MVFVMLARRTVLHAPLLLAAERVEGASRKMTLSLHQYTSAGAGYRKALEGWARAGIRNVEPSARLLDEYVRTESLAAAKRVLSDNGLTIVSGAAEVTGLWEPSPNFAKNLDASGNAASCSPNSVRPLSIRRASPQPDSRRTTM
jgi:hypothetical protein